MDLAPVTRPAGGGDAGPAARAASATAAAAAGLLLLLAGCGDGDRGPAEGGESTPEERRYGGTAVVGGVSEPTSMNGLVSTGYLSRQLQRHVLFTTLVRYDRELRPRPYLARSWELSEDSTEVVFRLRKDVRWHDGKPTTARDVAFTFRRAKNPSVPFPNRSYFRNWKSVDVVDRYTVRFTLTPVYGYLMGWARTPILPEHRLGDVPPEELRTHPFGERPLGNGPFRFVEHRPQQRWVFRANPEFPGELGGRPYLDRLVYRVVPDPAALMAELRAGGVDFYLDLPAGRAADVRRRDALRLRSYPVSGYAFVTWNTRRELFDRPSVRRALTLAVDRRSIVQSVLGGYGTVASGPVGPWHWAYDTAWSQIPHRPDSARRLLSGAGWRDRDGDGVRERQGREFRFDLVTSGAAERRDVAAVLQADLRKVGVRARTRVREPSAIASALTSPERRYEAALLSWVRDPVFDDRDLWACGPSHAPYAFTGYCDEELEAVLDSLPRATSRQRRRGLLERYRRIMVRDQPYTFLHHQWRLAGVRRRLRGVDLDVRGDLASVREWWLTPEGRGAGR